MNAKGVNQHPSVGEMAALVLGDLAPPRARAVLRHLLRPCDTCLQAALAACGIEAEIERPPVDYDAAISRAIEVASLHERRLRGQRAHARKILKRLEQGSELGEAIPRNAPAYAKFRAFLDRSWALRHEDPARMIELALYAAQCASRIDPQTYGVKLIFDFQCEAQAAVGNAYRVAQQLANAEAPLRSARDLFELGTRSPILEALLLELEAALDVAQRRFKQAIERVRKVYRYARGIGDDHLAGRMLLKQGLYTTYAGYPEEALVLLRRSLELIDEAYDPTLAYAARHNQIWILCDCDRFREAERQLFDLRRLEVHAGGRINVVKRRWEEGRIDAGLGRLERAEEVFRGVRKEMDEVNRGYDAALVSLDLAAVLMAQGKSRGAAPVVAAAYQTFSALRIEREALAAVFMLHTAFENGRATQALVKEVARFLRRFDNDPTLKFEPR